MPSQYPKNTVTRHISIHTAPGVIARDRHRLISMKGISQVLQVPKLTPVPFIYPWFLEIASIRSRLYGVTNLSRCLEAALTPQDERTRILLILRHLATILSVSRKKQRVPDLCGNTCPANRQHARRLRASSYQAMTLTPAHFTRYRNLFL